MEYMDELLKKLKLTTKAKRLNTIFFFDGASIHTSTDSQAYYREKQIRML